MMLTYLNFTKYLDFKCRILLWSWVLTPTAETPDPSVIFTFIKAGPYRDTKKFLSTCITIQK